MQNRPLVSVVMSVYNAQKYLSEAIRSVLDQTYNNLQIIIVNDGSTDNSPEIIRSFRDSRIVLVDRRENIGLTKSLNQALTLVQGQYIARQDADDTSIPCRIEQQLSFLQEHPAVSITGSGIEWFNGDKILRKYIYPTENETLKSQLFSYFNPIPHSTMLFCRHVAQRLGGYNQRFILAQDYDFLLRASEHFQIGSVNKPLVRIRFDTGSLTYRNNRQLLYGIAALICAYRRKQGICDLSQIHADNNQWDIFLGKLEDYITRSRIDKRNIARKYLRSAAFALMNRSPVAFLTCAFGCLANDPAILLGRKTILDIPNDIECFLN